MLLRFNTTMTFIWSYFYHMTITQKYLYHLKKRLTYAWIWSVGISFLLRCASDQHPHWWIANPIIKGQVFEGNDCGSMILTLCVAASVACESHTLCIVNAKTIQGVCADMRGKATPGDLACTRLLIMDGDLLWGTPTTSSWLSTQVYL